MSHVTTSESKSQETLKKSCDNCLYRGTREKCNGCLAFGPDKTDDYKHYESGDWQQRHKDFINSGKLNLVIGWTGEAEVNAKDKFSETLSRLCDVSEQCGYFTHKVKDNVIGIFTSDGYFELTWHNGLLLSVERVNPENTLQRSAQWTFPLI